MVYNIPNVVTEGNATVWVWLKQDSGNYQELGKGHTKDAFLYALERRAVKI
jgi:hypothetical protein